jgi:tetratricopeptide (TPR) repeat protein
MNENQKIALRLVILVLIGSLLSFVPVPYSVTEKTQKVQFAYKAGAYKDQANLLIALADELPWWTSLWESAGDASYLAEDYGLAMTSYESALHKKSLSNRGKIRLGDVYLTIGDEKSADEIWNKMGDSPDVLLKRAELYENQGNLTAAIETWRSYLIQFNDKERSDQVYYFSLLSAAYQPDQALPNLDQVREDYPDAAIISSAIKENLEEEPAYLYISTGQALASIGQWRLAGYAFERAIALRPDYTEAWVYWGESLQHIEEPSIEPLEALEKAQELEPESPLVNMFLGLYWQREGSHRTALSYFDLAEGFWPDHPDVYIEQGKSLAALTELDAAIEKIQKAIELAPDEGLYYSQLAELCLTYSYQVKELGLPAVRYAVQLDDQNPIFIDVLGQVMLELGDEMNALRIFQRAVELDPDYAPAYFHLAILNSARDDRDRTVYYLYKVLDTTNNLALIDRTERLLSNYVP